jgi:hypothetical protein
MMKNLSASFGGGSGSQAEPLNSTFSKGFPPKTAILVCSLSFMSVENMAHVDAQLPLVTAKNPGEQDG